MHSTPLQDVHSPEPDVTTGLCNSAGTFQHKSSATADDSFSLQGLRTLVLGTKVLTEEVWADWDSRYQDAAAQLDNRDEALAALAVEIEADLEFVGVTAIEDKLQEGVPAAIQSLLDAGMKVSACRQLNSGARLSAVVLCCGVLLICFETSCVRAGLGLGSNHKTDNLGRQDCALHAFCSW